MLGEEREKKTTWHKLLEQKCTKKLKIVATEKKCGEFQREKRTMVSKHTRSTKSLDFSEKKRRKVARATSSLKC